MDIDEIRDEAQRIDFTLDGEERINAHRAAADRLAPGTEGRSWFLEPLAETLVQAGRFDEARDVYDELEADGGDTVVDNRTGRLEVELKAGDDARADELLAQLLAAARADTLPLSDYTYIGEALEEAGRLRQALRWFTMPIRDIEPDALDESDVDVLEGRYRVRRALDLPLDAYDEVGAAISAAFGDEVAE